MWIILWRTDPRTSSLITQTKIREELGCLSSNKYLKFIFHYFIFFYSYKFKALPTLIQSTKHITTKNNYFIPSMFWSLLTGSFWKIAMSVFAFINCYAFNEGNPRKCDSIPGWRKRVSSQLKPSGTHWSPQSFLFNGFRGPFLLGQSGQDVNLSIHTAYSSKFKTQWTMPSLSIRLHGAHKDNLYFTYFMTPWPH